MKVCMKTTNHKATKTQRDGLELENKISEKIIKCAYRKCEMVSVRNGGNGVRWKWCQWGNGGKWCQNGAQNGARPKMAKWWKMVPDLK